MDKPNTVPSIEGKSKAELLKIVRATRKKMRTAFRDKPAQCDGSGGLYITGFDYFLAAVDALLLEIEPEKPGPSPKYDGAAIATAYKFLQEQYMEKEETAARIVAERSGVKHTTVQKYYDQRYRHEADFFCENPLAQPRIWDIPDDDEIKAVDAILRAIKNGQITTQ